MGFVLSHLRGLTLLAVVAAWGVRLMTGGALYADDAASQPPSSRAAQASVTPSHLLEAHDCWTLQAPADMRGQVPGHVVVTTRSGAAKYAGPRLVKAALDQQFAHKPAGLTIWGFCR